MHVTSYSENKLEIDCTWKLLDLEQGHAGKIHNSNLLRLPRYNSLASSNKNNPGFTIYHSWLFYF